MKQRLEILVNPFIRLNLVLLFLSLFLGVSCTRHQASPRPIPFSSKKSAPAKYYSPKSVPIKVVEPSDRERIDALRLVEKADKAYAEGNYGDAEAFLKKSLSLYPFIPKANLLLGKIFLIRGSASRDYTLINNARLMFEMARALDPEMAEIHSLLELFGARPVE